MRRFNSHNQSMNYLCRLRKEIGGHQFLNPLKIVNVPKSNLSNLKRVKRTIELEKKQNLELSIFAFLIALVISIVIVSIVLAVFY